MPRALCSVYPDMIIYEDASKNPRQLHWLDCSEKIPKLLGITANTNLGSVYDMCLVELENETLLIVISQPSNELMYAYNSTTGQLKWGVPKKNKSGKFNSYGVAGDGNGRLFIADHTQSCIQMLSVSNGQYLGCLMKQGDQGLGYVDRLCRSEATSSLVVGHHNGAKWFLSDVH